MELTEGKVNQRQSTIGFAELTSMVAELMSCFERMQADEFVEDDQLTSDWVSLSGLTRVVRYGSSASLHSVLNQIPNTISAEFEVIYRDRRVFSWCEYLWPDFQNSDTGRDQVAKVELPERCLTELMAFHLEHDTSWLRRYQAAMVAGLPWSDNRIKVNEVGVVAQPDRIQTL